MEFVIVYFIEDALLSQKQVSRKSYFHFLLYAHLTFPFFFFITLLHYLLDNFTYVFLQINFLNFLLKLPFKRTVL